MSKRARRNARMGGAATGVGALARRVEELELHLEARREEIETLQAQAAAARDTAIPGAADGARALLEDLRGRLTDLSRRIGPVEISHKLLVDLVEETRARLEILETGGLRQVVARLICLEAVDRALLAPVAWETAAGRALSVLTGQIGGRAGGLFLLEGEGRTLRLAARHPAGPIAPGATLSVSDSPSASQALSDGALRRSLLSAEAPLCRLLAGELPPAGPALVFSAPLIVAQRPRGVLSLVFVRETALSQDDEALLSELAARVALAFEAEVARRKVERAKGAPA